MVSPAQWIVAIWAGVLVPLAAGYACAGEPQWLEAARLGSFIYRADFHLVDRDRLLAELEQLRTELFKTLALPPPTETIELYLFRDEAAYRAYLDHRFGELPERRALYIKAGGPGMVYAIRGEQLIVDLRHETTHALLHAVLEDIPLWLDEGLAEYHETPTANRPAADPHYRDLQRLLTVRRFTPLESLELCNDATGMSRDDYLAAWAWMHFLLHDLPTARGELVTYLADLRSSESAIPLSIRLRSQMPDLQQRFENHVRRLESRLQQH